MRKGHRARLWIFGLLTLCVMLAIFCFSAQNADESQRLSDGFLASLLGRVLELILPRLTEKGMDFDIRKYAHMSEFFVLGVSCFLYVSELRRWSPDLRAAMLAFGFSLLYAGTDELHQLFVPGRACRITDVLVDGIGILAGVTLARLIQFGHDRTLIIS